MKLKRFAIVLFFLFASVSSQAQKITIALSSPQTVKAGVKLPSASYKDSASAVKSLSDFLVEWHKKGYLEASIDSIIKVGPRWIVVLYVGEPYRFASIKRGSLPLPLANKVGYSPKQFRGSTLNIREIYSLEQKIIKAAENNGYPFASIGLDSISIDDKHRLTASFKYDPGPFITVDSLIVVGTYDVKYKFFQRLVRIKKKDAFSQSKIIQSTVILGELPYVKIMANPEAYMLNGTARITYYLEKRKANVIDGYVGFMPNATAKNKLLVTGELRLDLKNLFRSGKTVMIHWQRYNEQSQYLKLYYEHPRFLGSGIDVSGLLEIMKQDTSFLNINKELKMSQQMGTLGKLDIFFGAKSGRILSQKSNTDTLNLAYGDFNNYIYGVGYMLNRLDNFFYPKRGLRLTGKVSLGNKTILENPFYGSDAYKNISTHSVQLNVEAMAEKFIRLSTKNILMGRINLAQVSNNKNSMYLNDFYRVGGLRTLRGFNENQFYVSQHAIGTVEYRFHTDEESYLLVFTDQAFISNPYVANGTAEYVFGLGAGISFTTQAGVFNFVYSVGQSSTQKLSLTLSKIHFGLVSKF